MCSGLSRLLWSSNDFVRRNVALAGKKRRIHRGPKGGEYYIKKVGGKKKKIYISK
jgi:hypothetical protein